MADDAGRSSHYEYKAKSNLVLLPDIRLIERRDRRDDATGEVTSPSGKLLDTPMGDRFQRTKPAETEERKAEPHKRDEGEGSSPGDNELIAGDVGAGAILYRPKTQETRQTYEVLLNFIQVAIGDQPRDVLCGAADEILAVLKNDRLKDAERKKETESLLGTLAEERFELLTNLGKKITDFQTKTTAVTTNLVEDDNLGETYGTDVQFDLS